MGNFSVFMTLLMGVKFIVQPVVTTKEATNAVSPQNASSNSIVCGAVIGFI